MSESSLLTSRLDSEHKLIAVLAKHATRHLLPARHLSVSSNGASAQLARRLSFYLVFSGTGGLY
jgi:hypothetical protein